MPGSKSITNRAFLIAALAKGKTKLCNLLRSDDTRYMGAALNELGVKIDFNEDYSEAVVNGLGAPIECDKKEGAELYLGNAGTAMRSLCAALTLGRGLFCLRGEERMKERPIRDLVEALRSLGAEIDYEESDGYPPVRIHANGLKGGLVKVRGNISSQYLTALLICAPYAKEPLHIQVEGPLISAPYILLTLDVMKKFGIEVRHENLTDFYVPQGVYQSLEVYNVEGDASSASYPLAAAAITGGTVRVLGLGSNSIQGDLAFTKVLQQMGAQIEIGPDYVECTGKELCAVDLNLNDIPDAAMTVAVLALFAKGTSRISGIASWRVKETDRIAAISAELQKVGATVVTDNDSITITPPETLLPATIETYNDHRMAMCFSLVALGGVPIKILDPACVNKTYPTYFEDFLKHASL